MPTTAERKNVIAVRATDAEYAVIRAGAAADGRSVADYVRRTMLAHAQADIQSEGVLASLNGASPSRNP